MNDEMSPQSLMNSLREVAAVTVVTIRTGDEKPGTTEKIVVMCYEARRYSFFAEERKVADLALINTSCSRSVTPHVALCSLQFKPSGNSGGRQRARAHGNEPVEPRRQMVFFKSPR